MDSIGIIGIVIGVASLVYAFFQGRKSADAKRLRVHNLRAALKHCNLIVVETDRLLRNAEHFRLTSPDAVSKVRSVHANGCAIVRQTFQELAELDLPYDDQRLHSYVRAGLISSEWFWQQAIMFVDSPHKIEPPSLPEHTKDYM